MVDQGVFQVNFLQDPEQTTVTYWPEQQTIVGALVVIVGITLTLYFMMNCFMSSYTKFNYESALARELFTTPEKNDIASVDGQKKD